MITSANKAHLRSRTHTVVLWWLAAVAGVLMSTTFHVLQSYGVVPTFGLEVSGVNSVAVGVDIALGVLALALLPAAITHDPLEVQESYVGPPSALVAGLVILSVWMVSVLAAPAGAIVLISMSARLSPNWTVSAFCASMLSATVLNLTFAPLPSGQAWILVLFVVVLTLVLITMGSVRGVLLRRQMVAGRRSSADSRGSSTTTGTTRTEGTTQAGDPGTGPGPGPGSAPAPDPGSDPGSGQGN